MCVEPVYNFHSLLCLSIIEFAKNVNCLIEKVFFVFLLLDESDNIVQHNFIEEEEQNKNNYCNFLYSPG